MTDLLQAVTDTIRYRACPIHHKQVLITIMGNELQLGTCCAEFKETMDKEAKEAAQKYTEGLPKN